jgi:hypothetical protein
MTRQKSVLILAAFGTAVALVVAYPNHPPSEIRCFDKRGCQLSAVEAFYGDGQTLIQVLLTGSCRLHSECFGSFRSHALPYHANLRT